VKKQAFHKEFLTILVALLENGFSMQESVQVILRSGQFPEKSVCAFQKKLTEGASYSTCFKELAFSSHQLTQIQLAENQGEIQQTLQSIVEYLAIVEKQQQELRKMIAYPLLLLSFMLALLIGMRLFLLPSLLETGMLPAKHVGVLFLTYAPTVFVSFLVGSVVLFYLSQQFFRKKSALVKARFFAKLPLVGTVYMFYQTSYFALEWGRLFKQGLEAKQILVQMKQLNTTSLLATVAKETHLALAQGEALAAQLKQYPFLTKEFSMIVYQGELTGKLGEELYVYSRLLLTRMVIKIEKLIQWIQPLVFLLIAALILSIYLAMFLPLYGNLGGNF